MLASERPSHDGKWIWLPTWSAAACVVLGLVSMGAGLVILAPVSIGLTILASRRIEDRRNWRFLIGVYANALLAIVVVWTVALLLLEVLGFSDS